MSSFLKVLSIVLLSITLVYTVIFMTQPQLLAENAVSHGFLAFFCFMAAIVFLFAAAVEDKQEQLTHYREEWYRCTCINRRANARIHELEEQLKISETQTSSI